MKPLAFLAPAVLLAAAFAGRLCAAPAFTVVKNVNDGRPLLDKVVLFDRARPHDDLLLADPTGHARISFNPAGGIEVTIIGHDAARPTIRWKPAGGLPASFDAGAYTAIRLTCAVLGEQKRTLPDGKVITQRPDNLWCGVTLLNTRGEDAGTCAFADVSSDGKTPAAVVTLTIPTVLFTQRTDRDTTQICGFAFPWAATHEYLDRDFHLVIERIALVGP